MGAKLDRFKEILIYKIIPYATILFLLIMIVMQHLHIGSLQREVEFLSKRTKLVVIDVVKNDKGNRIRVDTIQDTIKIDK